MGMTVEDREQLVMNAMLTDVHINAAQRLLLQKFDHISGCQLSLLVQTNGFKPVSAQVDSMQIHHNGHQHWLNCFSQHRWVCAPLGQCPKWRIVHITATAIGSYLQRTSSWWCSDSEEVESPTTTWRKGLRTVQHCLLVLAGQWFFKVPWLWPDEDEGTSGILY